MNCSIECLNEKYVTLRVTVNGEKMLKTYCNSHYDRVELEEKYSHDVYATIIEIWGDTPTIPDLPNPNEEK